MPRYMVVFTTGASAVVEVDARDTGEARRLANEKFATPSLCHQCAHHLSLGDWEHPEDDDDYIEVL